jgi:hypothetical protein
MDFESPDGLDTKERKYGGRQIPCSIMCIQLGPSKTHGGHSYRKQALSAKFQSQAS